MATQRAKRVQPRQRTRMVSPVACAGAAVMPTPQRGVTGVTVATTSTTHAANEWERWLAQFRPEARALMNLMVDINCRLAREAYARQMAQMAQMAQA